MSSHIVGSRSFIVQIPHLLRSLLEPDWMGPPAGTTAG